MKSENDFESQVYFASWMRGIGENFTLVVSIVDVIVGTYFTMCPPSHLNTSWTKKLPNLEVIFSHCPVLACFRRQLNWSFLFSNLLLLNFCNIYNTHYCNFVDGPRRLEFDYQLHYQLTLDKNTAGITGNTYGLCVRDQLIQISVLSYCLCRIDKTWIPLSTVFDVKN